MVPHPAHVLRVNASELLRTPGSRRDVDVELDASDLGIDDSRITGVTRVRVTATSSIDGIVVQGLIETPWQTPCRRCLTDASGVIAVDVDEMYQREVTDGEAFEIVGDQIDMAPAVREYIMIELPDGPLCRPDCAGICPTCGNDRNLEPCTCDNTVTDHRWAALDELRLDDQ